MYQIGDRVKVTKGISKNAKEILGKRRYCHLWFPKEGLIIESIQKKEGIVLLKYDKTRSGAEFSLQDIEPINNTPKGIWA